MMSYESPGAQVLRSYAEQHPENVVWSPERGWHNTSDNLEAALEGKEDQ